MIKAELSMARNAARDGCYQAFRDLDHRSGEVGGLLRRQAILLA
jgi:hypothetical protein